MEEAELHVIGRYSYKGVEVDGIDKTSWNSFYLITEKKLNEFFEKSERCDFLNNSQNHLMSLIKDGALSKRGSSGGSNDAEVESLKKELKEAQSEIATLEAKNKELQAWYAEPDFSDLRKELTKRSTEVRREKCQLATAVALSMSVRGSSTKEISVALRERKLSDSAAFISKALSIRNQNDKERLKNIMLAHPEEFAGVEDADFEQWYDRRSRKAEESARKRRIKLEIERKLNKISDKSGNI